MAAALGVYLKEAAPGAEAATRNANKKRVLDMEPA